MSATQSDLMQRFELDLPVVQGPFGGGLSTVQLAATVSDRGGLGSFGAHARAPETIATLTRELAAATSRRFALNLWISDHDPGGERLDAAEFDRAWRVFEPFYRELGVERPEPPTRFHPSYDAQVEALLEARPPVFSFVFGVPSSTVIQACRQRDILTVGTATSVAEAEALDAAGVDAIVATGAEAGGHRVSWLERAEDALMGTFALVQLVADRVRAPVIAAGGIADARGVRAALALGAQAAQIGTAFLACAESGTTDAHRAILFGPEAHRTRLTRAFTGRLARGVRNRWIETFEARQHELPPFPVTAWFVSNLRAAAQAAGDTGLVSLWCGQIAPNLRHRHAAELMQALHDGL
jgi:nitronate monooxygenase